MPDERLGEVGCAFVVARRRRRHAALPEEIKAWARDEMANYKVPRQVRIIDDAAAQRERQGTEDRAEEAGRRTDQRVRAPGPTGGRKEDRCEASFSPAAMPRSQTSSTVREPGNGEVLVAVQAAGVCHSDLSVIDGTIPWKPPSVLGHEGAGIVESVGPGVPSVEPGDHVVITTLANCGRCRACTLGHPTWCIRSLGNISTPFELDGEPASNFAATSVFVERTVVTEAQTVKIPDEVPFASACLIGCGVLTGVGAVLEPCEGRSRVTPPRSSGSGEWA